MVKPADPSVFEDTTNITEKDLIGKHVYPDVLYTGEGLKSAKEYAKKVEKTSYNHPCVAVRPNQHGPYRDGVGAQVFFCHSFTGVEWHYVFKNAIESDSYNVTHNADYSTGQLTINVEKVD